MQNGAGWTHLAFRCAPVDRLARNVLEFEGQEIETLCELTRRRFIFVSRGYFAIGELSRRRISFRTENVDTISHPARGNGEHAAELAAAHQTDGGARQVAPRHGTR